MAKITINDITAAFASATALNARFQQVEDALNDKVLYRDNTATPGEPNSMAQDLDMGTNQIINLVDPTNAQDAASKAYVDASIVGVGLDAANISNTPAGDISAVTVQAAIDELDTEKAARTEVILDSDFTEPEGFMRKTGVGTYVAHKSNLTATAAPTVNDDVLAGYSEGSAWLDLTNDDYYQCVDSSAGAAVWVMTGAGSGPIASIGVTAPITSSGGTTPTIAINPATTSTAGSLSAADKVVIDAVTPLVPHLGRPANKRQTILTGSVDSMNQPNFISIASGLDISVNGSTVPLTYGFSHSVILPDYIYTETSNTPLTLPASSVVNIYVDYDEVLDTVTYGYIDWTTANPEYSYIAPTTPAINKHWFDFNTMTMNYYNGSVWVPVKRLFIGVALTLASTVSLVLSFAINARYQSDIFSIVGSSTYNRSHGIHEGGINGSIFARGGTAHDSIRLEFEKTYNTNGAIMIMQSSSGITPAPSCSLHTYTTPSYVDSSGRATASYGQIIIDRIW